MKSSLYRIALITISTMLLAASGFGQVQGIRAGLQNFNFDFAGGGARAEGMGKAYIALSDDVTGGGWNPAGLHLHDGPIVGISWSRLSPRGKTTASLLSTTTELNHSGSFSSISALNLVAPIRIKGHKFVGSVNFNRNYDEFDASSFGFEETIADSVFSPILGTGATSQEYLHVINGVPGHRRLSLEEQLDGSFDTWNFSFGTMLYKKISFGISANIFAGTVVHHVLEKDSISGLESNISFNQPATHVLSSELIDSIRFSGLNFNIGLKYNGERTTAGLMIRTPMSIKAGAVSTLFRVINLNGLPFDSIIILTPNIDPPLIKYNMPLMVGGGISHRIKDNFLVALDAEYRAYSNSNFKIRDSVLINAAGNNTEFFTDADADTVRTAMWLDGVVIRMGGEYMKKTGLGTIPIRAGFSYVPVPPASLDSTKAGEKFADASIVANYNFSVGSGIYWEQIHLDAAYTYTTRSRDVVQFDLDSKENFVTDYEFKNHHFSLSFTGYF